MLKCKMLYKLHSMTSRVNKNFGKFTLIKISISNQSNIIRLQFLAFITLKMKNSANLSPMISSMMSRLYSTNLIVIMQRRSS